MFQCLTFAIEIFSKTKTDMSSQQWKNAEDSLFSLGKGNVESVDSIVRYSHRADVEILNFSYLKLPTIYNK
jgi:hypothetical protein